MRQKELNEKQRQEELEANKQKEIEDGQQENINESNESIAEELASEVNNVSIKTTPKEEQVNLSSENKVDEDLKSLEETDPWLQRKWRNLKIKN